MKHEIHTRINSAICVRVYCGVGVVKIFKKLFDFKDGEDLSRRKFIKDAASLAALTVVATAIPSVLKVKEIQDQINSGTVIGQTFYLDEPIVIDIDNVLISNCTFIATKPMPYMIKAGNVKNLHISHCSFDFGGNKIGAGMQFDMDNDANIVEPTPPEKWKRKQYYKHFS